MISACLLGSNLRQGVVCVSDARWRHRNILAAPDAVAAGEDSPRDPRVFHAGSGYRRAASRHPVLPSKAQLLSGGRPGVVLPSDASRASSDVRFFQVSILNTKELIVFVHQSLPLPCVINDSFELSGSFTKVSGRGIYLPIFLFLKGHRYDTNSACMMDSSKLA